jgi:methylated-DNA-[protein]-cysteine S-methyltransferase
MDIAKRIDALEATPLQRKVWHALCTIPRGTVITYAALAKKVGKPCAVRAVASAVGKNPFAPMVPCHRVVRSDGTLGGYSAKGGVKTKRALLKKEGVAQYR